MTIDKHPSLGDRKKATSIRGIPVSGMSNLSGFRSNMHVSTSAASPTKSSYDSWSYEKRQSTKYQNSASSSPVYSSSSSFKRDSEDHGSSSRNLGGSYSLDRNKFRSGASLGGRVTQPDVESLSYRSTLPETSEISSPYYGSLRPFSARGNVYDSLAETAVISSPLSYSTIDKYPDAPFRTHHSLDSPLSVSIHSHKSGETPSTVLDSALSTPRGFSKSSERHSLMTRQNNEQNTASSDYYHYTATSSSKQTISSGMPKTASTSTTTQTEERRQKSKETAPKFRLKKSKPLSPSSPSSDSSTVSTAATLVLLKNQHDASGNLLKSPIIRGSLKNISFENLPTTLTTFSPDGSSTHTDYALTSTPLSATEHRSYHKLSGPVSEVTTPAVHLTDSSLYPGDVDYLHTYNKYNEMRHVSFIDYGVTTVYPENDDAASTIASTSASTGPPVFHLLRKSDVHAARVEAPATDQLKVDIYSVGVIMDSKMTGTFDPDKLKVEAVAPTGRIIRITGDGQYAAPFTSDEIGRWKVSMYYDGRYMDGCPIDVCDPSQVKIRDLQGGHVGKPNLFHVDCTKAGPGDLGVDVSLKDRPVSTHITPTSTPGYFKVNFTPFAPGPYEVNVHFNRAEVREGDVSFFDPEERQRKAVFYTRVDPKPGYVEVKASCDWEVDYITGGPFVCHVTDSTDISVYGMEDGTVCAHPTLIADCTRVGEGHIQAEVTHHGLRFPCKIRKDKPCVYRVSFKPRGPGTYKVWINYDGQPVKGSPFIQEIAELEKPTAHGDGLYRGVPGKPAVFTVDPRGFPGQVSVGVHGPSQPVRSTLEPQPDNTIKATYYPTERGPHTVDVKLDGRNIDGSPYHPLIVDPVSVRVSGGWRPYLDEKGLIPLRVNKEKHLPFDVSEAGPGELTAEVQGPNGKIPVAIDARNDGKHSVIFTPREEGKHYIHVNWGGYPLHSSPYMGYATHEPELQEDENIRLVPIALHSPTYPTSYPSSTGSFVDGRKTPEPYLIRQIGDPNENQNAQPYHYRYQPQEPIRDVEPVPPLIQAMYPYPEQEKIKDYPPSPRPMSVLSVASQPSNGPQKVILSGRGLKEAEVDKPAVFYVDGTQANPGKPRAYLQGVKDQLPVSSDNIRPQVYKCTYIPEKPGAYLLYVNWNDKPLRGSPFKVNIKEPNKLHLVTATLEKPNPVVGEDLEMRVDPRQYGGPSHLTARCTDPIGQDLPIKVSDNLDGTKGLKFKPVVPGRHIVEVRLDGTHIKGSPFAFDIKANNNGLLPVKVWGPGIESGVINNFQSTFWVETTGAGAGDLRVRIVGPKGAFHVKMRKASQRDKIYQCFYDPIEPGVYMVHVQWSSVHVAGSPFQVILAMNERDLQRMMGAVSDDTTSNSIINGGHYNNSRNSVYSSKASDLDNDVSKRKRKKSKKNSEKRRTSHSDIVQSNSNDILY